MPRSRLVHRSARAAGQALVSEALEPAAPIDGNTGLGDSAAKLSSPITLSGGGPPHHVQVEDVDPRRMRLLLEIDRTGSISAAAKRCAIGQPSASMYLRTLETAVGQETGDPERAGEQVDRRGEASLPRTPRGCWRLSRACDRRWTLLNAPGRGANSHSPQAIRPAWS